MNDYSPGGEPRPNNEYLSRIANAATFYGNDAHKQTNGDISDEGNHIQLTDENCEQQLAYLRTCIPENPVKKLGSLSFVELADFMKRQ